MKQIFKGFLAFLIFMLIIVAAGLVSGHTQLFFMEYFGVKKQNIQTQIYKETEMYNEGKIQELAKARLEYQQADSLGQKAVGSMIRHRFADYEAERLPDELAKFLIEIRGY